MLMKGTARKDAYLARVWQEQNCASTRLLGTSVMEERSFPAILEAALRLARILFREGFDVASLIHSTSEPMAEWLSCKIVFTSSSSPHTMILAKRLNQRPDGTVGSVSSHLARFCRSSIGTARSRTLSARCSIAARGTSLRRTFGMAKEPVHQFLLEAVALLECLGIDHLLRKVSQFAGGKWACFKLHCITECSGRSLNSFEGSRGVLYVERPPHSGAPRA